LSKCKFDCLLIKAVDESLSCLGVSVKHSIYFYLENSFGLRRNEIPRKPEAFSQNLEVLFKDGSNCIEKLILKRLYETVGLKFEYREGRRFADYINEVRRFLAKQRRKGERGPPDAEKAGSR